MYQVLLADDDPVLHYILQHFDWEMYGFKDAAQARTGSELTGLINSRKFDLAIVDLRLPDAGGIELIKELHQKHPELCVILLSTYSDFEYAQRGMRYGIADCLTKPVSPQELSAALRRIADYLHSHGHAGAQPADTLYKAAMDSLPEYFTIEDNPSSIVLGICTFVTENVEKDISLETVANALQLSRDYTGRIFKKKTGINFVEYASRVKMERAKQLLATARYKNYEVSAKLGFKTPDYFTSLFKKYVGTTPIEYRLSVHKDSQSADV